MQLGFRFNLIICLFISILFCKNAFSVNIFSWWGYWDDEIIEKLEDECNTTISIDEYYSNDEFIRRFDNQKYSIIVFSSEIYIVILNKFKNIPLNFEEITKKYHPNILASFKKQSFKNNIVLVGLGRSGFLYNKNKVFIHKDDNLKFLFSKSKNNKIIILDDAIESLKLFYHINNVPRTKLEIKYSEQFIFTNDFPKKIDENFFTLGYFWIGEAYNQIKLNSNLKFIVHSKLNHVTADLLAALDNNSDTACVAKAMSRKDTLNLVTSKSNYFSPYGVNYENDNEEFIIENISFLENIKDLKWIERPSIDDYQKVNNLWQKIKIEKKN